MGFLVASTGRGAALQVLVSEYRGRSTCNYNISTPMLHCNDMLELVRNVIWPFGRNSGINAKALDIWEGHFRCIKDRTEEPFNKFSTFAFSQTSSPFLAVLGHARSLNSWRVSCNQKVLIPSGIAVLNG